MKRRYLSPDQIPDEVIAEEYLKTDTIRFSARPFNTVIYRSIAFGELGWWLSLIRVLPLVGVTPQMLRPVFNPQTKWLKLPTRRKFRWFGSRKFIHHLVVQTLPDEIATYHQLGGFPLSVDNFLALSKVLGKSIEVYREDGGSGEHRYLFTVTSSGEVVRAAAV
jgi:hypothetical protein